MPKCLSIRVGDKSQYSVLVLTNLETAYAILDDKSDSVLSNVFSLLKEAILFSSPVLKPDASRPAADFDCHFFVVTFVDSFRRWQESRLCSVTEKNLALMPWILEVPKAMEVCERVRDIRVRKIVDTFCSMLCETTNRPLGNFDLSFAVTLIAQGLDRADLLSRALAGTLLETCFDDLDWA